MVGKLTRLPGGCLLAAAVLSNAFGQATGDGRATPAKPESKRPGGLSGGPEMRRPEGGRPGSERFENVRKSIDSLTPEQRRRFHENFQRWSNLSPEEKKALADRDAFRRRKIAEDIDAAIHETGLDLDAQGREHFAKRYGEERRRIEDQLRRDMEEKRRPLLKELISRLKAEFESGTPGVEGAAQSPESAPKP